MLESLRELESNAVSELAGGAAYAVETVVSKTEINTLIPQLKARGASDIVELPLSKIVP